MPSERIPFSKQRRYWPSEALAELRCTPTAALNKRGILEKRSGRPLAAQNLWIAALAKSNSLEETLVAIDCLAGLRLRSHQLESCRQLLQLAQAKITGHEVCPAAIRLRQHQLAWAEGERQTFVPQAVDAEGPDPLEQLEVIQGQLASSTADEIKRLMDHWPNELQCPEAIELRARALRAIGDHQNAFEAFMALLSHSDGSATTWSCVLELNYLGQRSNGLALATASRLHPRDPGIATHRVLVLLNDRQPAEARRAAFKERVLYTLGKRCPSRQQSDSNLVACYDQTGRSDLMPWLHNSLLACLPDSPPLHANVTMQLASQTSALYGGRAEAHAKSFPNRLEIAKRRVSKRPLRVGLISPDLYYHPVGRFVQMLIASGLSGFGDLHVINTGKPALPRLQELAGNNYHSCAAGELSERLNAIRSLELDLAVDLAGWTGDNNGTIFASGVAPIQVNYLGYFASSGLEAMDVWLGDQIVFPEPMQEWHSERIVRLQRPFIAWQPDQHLREGNVAVPPAPSGPITFGCFNHVRKLSQSTLCLWAQLLREIPGSRLALKAFTSDDPGVVTLIEKRMRRCGLDPAAVLWLPTAPKPEDHLRQYGLVDVALDPFPNGGCTTTCEALWMGVPVITLCGSHYVSRMSSAVLHGAHLPEWVATTQEHYLQLAVRASQRLKQIRAGRAELRRHLQNSPLGDASDLATHLWACFEQLA